MWWLPTQNVLVQSREQMLDLKLTMGAFSPLPVPVSFKPELGTLPRQGERSHPRPLVLNEAAHARAGWASQINKGHGT